MIRKAKIEDIDIICQIAEDSKLIDNKVNNINNGFLVSDYTGEDYKMFIKHDCLFYVLEKDNIVIAFLLAFNEKDMDSSFVINKTISDIAEDPYIIIKQICVNKNYARNGYGTELCEYFMMCHKKDIYTSVVLEPENKASINFHNKMGFICILTQTPEDNKRRAIYYRKYKINYSYDYNFIFKNYKNAMKLYTHEDQLNWTKINHLLTINMGLIGFTGLIITNTNRIVLESNIFAGIIIFISLFGIAVNLLFNIAIENGIFYLQNRKKSVATIEHTIISMGGINIVTNKKKDDERLNRSNTIYIKKIIPKLFCALWVLAILGFFIFII